MHRIPMIANLRGSGRQFVALLFVFAVAGACSTSAGTPAAIAPSASTTPAAPTNAPSAPAAPAASSATAVTCAILSTSDIQGLTGASSVKLASETEPSSGLANCEWQLDTSGTLGVNIATGPNAEAVSAATWTLFSGKPAVSGVGNEAHWDATAQTIAVKSGTSFVSVAVVGPGVTDPKAAATALAKLIVTRLGG